VDFLLRSTVFICGYEENADINAAKNVLAAGRAVMFCGGVDAA